MAPMRQARLRSVREFMCGTQNDRFRPGTYRPSSTETIQKDNIGGLLLFFLLECHLDWFIRRSTILANVVGRRLHQRYRLHLFATTLANPLLHAVAQVKPPRENTQ